jgi:gamma-glutamyltranspeptidase
MMSAVLIEEGYGGRSDRDSESLLAELRRRGHVVVGGKEVNGKDRSVFGKAQIIMRNPNTGVLWAGSEKRCDGCAMPVL